MSAQYFRSPGATGKWVLLLAMLFCFTGPRGRAQNPTGTIFGIVTDPSGGRLSGVQITIGNTDTGLQRQTTTREAGEYRVPLLPAGNYEVTATLAGFKTAVRSSLQLNVQATLRADILMQVGEVRESVRVTEQAPLLETETSASGHVIQSGQIVNLPLNVRQFMQLTYLVPFATPATRDYRSSETDRGTPVPAGAGARPEENNYQIDGIDNKESGRNNFSVTPPIDSIGEFRVQTGMAPAEFGRGGGTVINLATRSGSNEFHGSAYEFVRNNAFDARPFFSNRVNPLKRNQFGGSIGGPIVHNKLLFFANYEGFRQSATGNPPVGRVPTAEERQGIFQTTITNPITGRVYGNRIDPADINPVSAKILNLWPLPNNPGDPARNFIFNAVPPAHDNRNWVVSRMDYNMSSKDTLYGRYLFDNEVLQRPPQFPNGIGAGERPLRAQTAGGHYVHTLTPHVVNDASYGYMRYYNLNKTAFSYKENFISQFGITNTFSDTNPLFWGTPGVSIPGYLGTDSGNPNYRLSNVHEIQDGVNWNRGSHFLKFGGDFRIVDTTMLYTGGNGNWSFTNRYSGDNFADFLLGLPATVSKTARRPLGINRIKYLAAFLQDDIKLTRKLTLNLGVRYEVESVPDDPDHAMIGFDPKDGALLVPTSIASHQLVEDFYRNVRPDIKYRFIDAKTPINADTNNFAPRIGFAWQLEKNTTLRGGYGIFYGSPQTASYLASGANDFPPNGLRPIWVSDPGKPSLVGYNPEGATSAEQSLKNASLTIFPFVAGRVTGHGIIDYNTGRDFPYAMVQQVTVSVQHQIGSNVLVEVQYFGSRTRHLIGNDNIQVTTPGPGAVAPRLPYAGWARIENTAAWHRARYNGMALKAEQRLSHGLSYLVSYTFSKSLDDASTLNDDPEWTDPQNKFSGFGPSDFDARHRFVSSFQYELPFGRARRFGSQWSRITDALLGGWGVRGITSFQTGFEYSPTMAVSRVGYCLAACTARAERVGNGNLAKDVRTINRFWDISAFRFPAPFTLGFTSGRNVLYGPGVNNWDLDIYKEFRIREAQSLEFRYEAFNAFNHPQFAAPSASFESPSSFGKVTGTAAPRVSQFVLRYVF